MKGRRIVVTEWQDDQLSTILSRRDLGFGGPTFPQYQALEQLRAGYREADKTEFELLDDEE